jgi:propanol-preferring alcohol dehydrogenase
MDAMVLNAPHQPLSRQSRPVPVPGQGQILVEVGACAVCRTDLHIVDGELRDPKLPLVLGHEVIGRVSDVGSSNGDFAVGDRVGIPWLGWTCGDCRYCRAGRENLCDSARFTGYTLDGGYAQLMVANERFAVRIPEGYDDFEAAPLLCAGLIGYRSLVQTGAARRVGIYGFGAAAHIITQIAVHQGREVYAFTRPGDTRAQQFAQSLGCTWAGSSSEQPPRSLDAAIIFAPVGSLVPSALSVTDKGGAVVCGGIHMTDIPSFPYELLWGERRVVSVANLTRRDADEFMTLASKISIKTTVHPFSLFDANDALQQLRTGKIEGAAVLVPRVS